MRLPVSEIQGGTWVSPKGRNVVFLGPGTSHSALGYFEYGDHGPWSKIVVVKNRTPLMVFVFVHEYLHFLNWVLLARVSREARFYLDTLIDKMRYLLGD